MTDDSAHDAVDFDPELTLALALAADYGVPPPRVKERLMARLAEIAHQEGHDRIDWTADADDLRLQHFYEMLAGRALPEKRFFRIAGAKLRELAEM